MGDVARLGVRGWVFIAPVILLGACGGGEETAAVATGANTAPTTSGTPPTIAGMPPTIAGMPPTSEPPNRAPTIAGAPGTAVMHGTEFSFTPTGTDPDGAALTYSIVNAPAWASFDAATGRLSGTPGAEHVGATHGIVISVSDGERTASLAAFSVTVHAVATGSATLSWLPPTTNSDGSPLTNLAGYKIYWGNAAGSYPHSVTLNNPGLTRYVVTELLPGTWFFAATALNGSGVESTFSSPASGTIR